mmetsp:Transcript_5243/g.17648  ORF Transcript_5243/g.17648 Transcript_5243/m.17648 type:complete len:240 (+) Transcript_5243:87-806(+)
MALLAGKSFVVTGATGNVGRGVALAALNHGARVVIVGRDTLKLTKLKADYLRNSEDVLIALGDVSTEEGVQEAKAKALEALGTPTVDYVFSSSGPWWQVPPHMSEVPFATFKQAINANVEAHFLIWQAFSPVTKACFVAVNGSAMKHLPHTGVTGFTANSVEGLCKLFAAEAKAKGTFRFLESFLEARVADEETSQGAWPSEKYGNVVVAMVTAPESDEWHVECPDDEAVYKKITAHLQ